MSGASAIVAARSTNSGACGPNLASGSTPVTMPSRSRCSPATPSATGPCSSVSTTTNPTPGCATRPGSSAGQRAVSSSRVSRCFSPATQTRPRLPDPNTRNLSPLAGHLGVDGVDRQPRRRRAARARPSTVSVPAEPATSEFSAAAALVVLGRRHGRGVGEPGDQRGEVLAVPVREDLALALAVVRQHDQVVLPRCDRGDRLELGEYGVDAGQRVERLGLADAGVVGDRVVVHVVDVDDPPPAQHRVGDQGGVEVAEHAGERGPLERERPAPVHPRPHVAALGAGRLEPLAADLAERPRHAAGEAGRPAEVLRDRAPRLAGLAGAVDRAHRGVRRRRVAGEQVADRHAVVGEQAAAVRSAAPRSPAASPGLLAT